MNGNAGIYQFRERLILFYKRQEYLLLPVLRFAVSLALLLLLRTHLGAHGPAGAALGSTLLNVIIALVCSMLPPGYAAGIIALVMVWDLYKLSLEATAICVALLLLCILLYFRFVPRDIMVLLVIPIAYALNVHYAVPVIAGLLFGPGTAVPIIFGLVFARYVVLVEEKLPSMGGTDAALTGERLISNFRSLVDGIMKDRELIVLVAALALTAVIVCFIRHLVMANAWIVAITVGSVLELAVLLLGDMKYETNIDLARVFIGIAVSFLLAQIFRFFAFNVDYLRIESTQFEDEDYYYYVKAVPKVMVPVPSMTVRNFSSPGYGDADYDEFAEETQSDSSADGRH